MGFRGADRYGVSSDGQPELEASKTLRAYFRIRSQRQDL